MSEILRAPLIAARARTIGKPARQQVPAAAEGKVPANETEARVASPAAPSAHAGDQAALSDLKAQLQLQYETAVAQARADAEKQGYADGMRKVDEAAKAILQQQREHLARLIAALDDARRQVLADSEDTLVDIVYTAVCRIIGEAATTRAAVAGMVNDLATRCRDRERVRIHVHPQDWEMLQQQDETGDVAALDRRVDIEPDTSILLGGCVVESAVGTLDARLETQLERLRDTLLSVRRVQPGQEAAL